MIDYPINSKPHIKWNHIDGPLLCCSDGRPHWLTLLERLYLRAGIIDIEYLDKKYKYNDDPCKE